MLLSVSRRVSETIAYESVRALTVKGFSVKLTANFAPLSFAIQELHHSHIAAAAPEKAASAPPLVPYNTGVVVRQQQ